MVPDKQTTGFPPVTETEERLATETAPCFGPPSVQLSAHEKIVTDAISAVIERHRAEIKVARVSAEARRHALDLLDAVLLDVLVFVLNKTSTKTQVPR